jgi:thymidine phosphorylase
MYKGTTAISNSHLLVKNIGIDTYRENIVFMRYDCDVCRSEGFSALTRVVVSNGNNSIIATLNVVTSDIIEHHEVGLSSESMKRLNVKSGDTISVTHLNPIESFKRVRGKMFGKRFTEESLHDIISDIVSGRYSNIELAAFIIACVNGNLNMDEIIWLTRAMIGTGVKLDWGKELILDKHCVGGIPGNRTTPIVVSIIAALGLIIPKTSSRAITSPAGTADTMETMTPVDLTIDKMRSVVEAEGGCMVWGGAVQLSPADDILISVEKALDIDSEGQMIASVLSKKVSAGSTRVVVDVPVGPTAKVRTSESALHLQKQVEQVGSAIGLKVTTIITDGSQPVGKGIGPALEAHDVLAVLRNSPSCSVPLKERALLIAGALLELAGSCKPSEGIKRAREVLESGAAYKKFIRICEAQGGFKEPPSSTKQFDILASTSGKVVSIDNRTLARIAKLAGAPRSPAAGVEFFAPLGNAISKGDLLYRIHSTSDGEMNYARSYVSSVNEIVTIV